MSDSVEPNSNRGALEAFERLLLLALPGLVPKDSAVRGEGATLREFDSPTGDERRRLRIWISDGDPSVAFGGWHTHASILATASDPYGHMALIDIVSAIFEDEFVLVEEEGEIDGQAVEDIFGLDLREPDAILDYQTDPHRLGRARLLSWTGSRDQPL